MKGFSYLLALCLCCCTTRPKVTYVDPATGQTVSVDLGGTFGAEADGILASVELPNGTKAKYSAIREDSTKVLGQAITTGGAVAGGIILNRGEEIREVGATKRHAIDSATTLGLDKGVTERATFVPTVTPPAQVAR